VSGPVQHAGHVFISYVREDSHHVDQLQARLESAGVRVWRDTVDLWPGQDWRVKIRQAIMDNALVFIACFSRESIARAEGYQNEELTLAIEQLRRRSPDVPWLIPVRFDDCNIPDRDIGAGRTLNSIQRADLFGAKADEGMGRLLAAILRILGPEAVPAPDRQSPSQRAAARQRDQWPDLDALAALSGRPRERAGKRYFGLSLELWTVIGVIATVIGVVAGLVLHHGSGPPVATGSSKPSTPTVQPTGHRSTTAPTGCRARYPVILQIPPETGSSVGITSEAVCNLEANRTYLVIEKLLDVSAPSNPHSVYFVKATVPHLKTGQVSSAQITLLEPVGARAYFYVISVDKGGYRALQQNRVVDNGILFLPQGTRQESTMRYHVKGWNGP
jgi:hypothetical protein